ncbi:MAG: hypothetical protein C0514_08445 [Candidatus Puniceispirillum sp.]|nr:hypothetical protein [Candidatus Puniceispirillum sp.]
MARFCLLFSTLFWASAVHAKTHQQVLWNVPISHTSFWGRKAQLIELEQKLTKGPVVVTGLSGIGKSRLAFTYAKKHAHTYKLVWVFDASQGMDKQMIDFANKLYASQNKGKMGSFARAEEASHYAKTLLRTCAFSWLLIFDGAASFAKVEETIPETFQTKDKHVLVSSLSDKGASGVLRLEALSDAEAHEFLKHYLKDASDGDIKHLATVLANHPLAMVQAANYINATPGMDVDAYIAFFTKSKKEYWASESKALQGQSLLFTAIKMSIDKLKEASPKDYMALVALCMLNTHEIDRPMIGKIYAQLTQGDMAGFGKIMDVALISKSDTNTYAVHDYVRDVVLATADRATLKEAATLDARIFLSLLPEKIEDCVGVFEKDPALVGHLKGLMSHMDLMQKNDAFAVGVRLFY